MRAERRDKLRYSIHTSAPCTACSTAYGATRQHTSAYVSIYQHTVIVSIHAPRVQPARDELVEIHLALLY